MNNLWYKNTVMYGLPVQLFKDSNGDGWGDFGGILEKFDYLTELGVDCIWLLPTYPSPFQDNGYDVRNYLGIEPRLGDLETFEQFLEKARTHRIRVLMDLPANHSSSEHPWFQAARRSAKSPYRDYYIWAEEPVKTDANPIFPGQEDDVWTYDERAKAYYYHIFYSHQPDLKISNPAVRAEIERVIQFWMVFPISGFRLDAAPHLISDKGGEGTAPEHPHQVIRDWLALMRSYNPEAILMGEADLDLNQLQAYFGEGDELPTLQNFLVSEFIFLALAAQDSTRLAELLQRLPKPERGGWINFLRNLDELDMERLPDREQDVVNGAFAPHEGMRVFGRGIRRRVAPMLGGDQTRIENAYSLLFSMPGSPLIMYGDEIGMGENLNLDERQAVRTPMQWNSEKNAGFSVAEETCLPVIAGGQFDYRQVNVASQREIPGSLLNFMNRLIRFRKESPQVGTGQLHLLESGASEVLAHAFQEDGILLLAVHNLSGHPCKVAIELPEKVLETPEADFGEQPFQVRDGKRIELAMDAYGYQWLRWMMNDND